MAKVQIGKTTDLGPGKMKLVKIEGHGEIVLANVGGKFHAMKGTCGHEGGPLWEGELAENVITCPWHGAKWDVSSGNLVEFPLDLDPEPYYPVTVDGENLFIEI